MIVSNDEIRIHEVRRGDYDTHEIRVDKAHDLRVGRSSAIRIEGMIILTVLLLVDAAQDRAALFQILARNLAVLVDHLRSGDRGTELGVHVRISTNVDLLTESATCRSEKEAHRTGTALDDFEKGKCGKNSGSAMKKE